MDGSTRPARHVSPGAGAENSTQLGRHIQILLDRFPAHVQMVLDLADRPVLGPVQGGAGRCAHSGEVEQHSGAAGPERDRWSSGGPAEERQGIPPSQLQALCRCQRHRREFSASLA